MFKAGDRVKCVKILSGAEGSLTIGQTYIVDKDTSDWTGTQVVTLKDCPVTKGRHSDHKVRWYSAQFELVKAKRNLPEWF